MKKIYYYLIGILLLITSFIFDKEISLFFTNYRIEFLNAIAIFINKITGYILFGIVFLIFLSTKQYKKIIPLVIAFISYYALTSLIKIMVARPRPFIELNNSLVVNENSYRSFPSGHATASATIIPFFNFNKKLYYAWFLIAIIISLSRVYLGVHYLSDVIVGFMFGNFIGDASIYLVNKYKNYKKFTHRKV